jgi:hypothetical protein
VGGKGLAIEKKKFNTILSTGLLLIGDFLTSSLSGWTTKGREEIIIPTIIGEVGGGA